MKIPFEVKDISNSEELFGREQLLNKLLIDASLKQNISIIGARRFGKTCVLKTIQSILKEKGDLHIYPVYLDVKTENIRGTDNVYKYFIGILIRSLFIDGIFIEKTVFRATTIEPSDDWTEVAEQLEGISSSRIQALFQNIVKWFSELMDSTILFLIDEYEYLFKYALDSPTGFCKLRTMSSETMPNGSRPFCFWLTGATSWDQIRIEVPGSGEANTISDYEYVTPISKDSFNRMWVNECSLVDDEEKKKYLLSCADFAYEKSGGVPFYGKNVIGTYIFKNGSLPDYSICSGHFKELSNKALNCGEYSILKNLAISPRKIASSESYINLKNKGIISVKTKDISYIPIGFLNDFILGELADDKGSRDTLPETYSIMKSIADTILRINRQRQNQKKSVVFPPVMDGSSLEDDLRTPCYTKEQLSDFASALYRYYYERLKGSREEFGGFLYGRFGKCVDAARHSLGGGHEMDFFETGKGKFSHADMLQEIMGNVNEMSSPHEYYTFQLAMLKRFKSTVDIMFDTIKKSR
jgi:hypothetical protein